MSSQLVLVTGATGFIAAHVVEQLLQAGYRVRATARGPKVQQLRESYQAPGLEYVAIDDVATSDFTDALKDVNAVVHVAAPLPGKASAEDTIKTSISGSLNVLAQAEKAGITKFVITSTIGSIMDASLKPTFQGLTVTDSDWSPTTHEDVLKNSADSSFVYFGAKALAEKAVWDFARAHPHIDVATVLPAIVYGPYSKFAPLPANASQLGTNSFVWALINGTDPGILPPYAVDVRDVAKTHVLALKVDAVSPEKLEDKRFLSYGGTYTWRHAAADLKTERPSLNILDVDKISQLPGVISTVDASRTERILGFKAEEYISPKIAIRDAADALTELAKAWKAAENL